MRLDWTLDWLLPRESGNANRLAALAHILFLKVGGPFTSSDELWKDDYDSPRILQDINAILPVIRFQDAIGIDSLGSSLNMINRITFECFWHFAWKYLEIYSR